jgi:hypothetical protein
VNHLYSSRWASKGRAARPPKNDRSYHEKGFPDTQVFQPLKQTRQGVETGSYEILIPNTLFEEELLRFTEAQKRAMLRGGLKVIDLPGERVLRAQQVVRAAPQLSARSDCSVPGKVPQLRLWNTPKLLVQSSLTSVLTTCYHNEFGE